MTKMVWTLFCTNQNILLPLQYLMTDCTRDPKRKYLNHIMWSSTLQPKLVDGFYTKIISFFDNDEPHFWSCKKEKILLRTDESSARVFKIKLHPGGKIVISTADETSIVQFDKHKKIKVRKKRNELSGGLNLLITTTFSKMKAPKIIKYAKQLKNGFQYFH